MISNRVFSPEYTIFIQTIAAGLLMLGSSWLAAEGGQSTIANADQAESYGQAAKNELSPNEIKAFVYQWFANFDHQVASERIINHLGDQVDMAFPDFPIRSKTDFARWYQGVIDSIQCDSHEITDLKVTGSHASG